HLSVSPFARAELAGSITMMAPRRKAQNLALQPARIVWAVAGHGRRIRMSWQPELDELRERERKARELGGADKVKRQHDAGKLTIRERIDALVDTGSFHEIGAIAGRAQ